jgi:hypothetical protein
MNHSRVFLVSLLLALWLCIEVNCQTLDKIPGNKDERREGYSDEGLGGKITEVDLESEAALEMGQVRKCAFLR